MRRTVLQLRRREPRSSRRPRHFNKEEIHCLTSLFTKTKCWPNRQSVSTYGKSAKTLASRFLPVMVFSLKFRGFRDIRSLETIKQLLAGFIAPAIVQNCDKNLPMLEFEKQTLRSAAFANNRQFSPGSSLRLPTSYPSSGSVGRHSPALERLGGGVNCPQSEGGGLARQRRCTVLRRG
jgi:hypothetical protein